MKSLKFFNVYQYPTKENIGVLEKDILFYENTGGSLNIKKINGRMVTGPYESKAGALESYKNNPGKESFIKTIPVIFDLTDD